MLEKIFEVILCIEEEKHHLTIFMFQGDAHMVEVYTKDCLDESMIDELDHL